MLLLWAPQAIMFFCTPGRIPVSLFTAFLPSFTLYCDSIRYFCFQDDLWSTTLAYALQLRKCQSVARGRTLWCFLGNYSSVLPGCPTYSLSHVSHGNPPDATVVIQYAKNLSNFIISGEFYHILNIRTDFKSHVSPWGKPDWYVGKQAS